MSIRPLEPGPVEHDEDGDPVPQPAPNSDLADLMQMLEYGRKKGFRFGPTVRIGKIVTTVVDLRQAEGRDMPDTPDRGPWAAVGYDPDQDSDVG